MFQLTFSGHDPATAHASAVQYNVRVMNMMWRVKHETEVGLERRLEADARRKPVPIPADPTQTSRRTIAEQASQTKIAEQAALTLERLRAAKRAEYGAVEQLFASTEKIPERAGEAPEKSPRIGAMEAVIGHCLATGKYVLAGKLAMSMPTRSAELKAALVAVEPAAVRNKLTDLNYEAAADKVSSQSWGRGWSRFTRESMRARVYALAGHGARASSLHHELNAQRDNIFAAFSMLCVIAALAAMVGLFMWVTALVRARVARMQGAPPFGWLRARFGGLGSDVNFVNDPIVPLLGLGGWLLGYTLAATALSAIPTQRPAGGFAVLLQGLAGIIVTWAVISAFSRTLPPLGAARIFPSPDVESPWRASTAALQAFCAMLPAILFAMLASALLAGGDGDPHPVAQMLLDDPSLMTMGALGIAVVIIAPIGEELFFRGFLHQTLRQRFGPLFATLATGLLFAAVHMSPSYFLILATLGVTFSLVFEWVGSLWASIILHAIWNGCVYVFILCIAFS
jgi:membrane protease YdiL (CAAX protease family)